MKKNICVDFDGVLNVYTHYDPNDLCEMREGCPEFLKKLSQKYKVTILSTREQDNIIKWLEKHNVSKYVTQVTNIKIPAVYYIDDRAVKFDGDFEKILDKVSIT